MSWVQHDRIPSHSRTKENRLLIVIQNQEALLRKLNNLKPLFGNNKELNVSKEDKENALASYRGQIMLTRNNNCKKNHYVCHDLSAWNKQQKLHYFVQLKYRTLQSIIYPPEKKFIGTSSVWYSWGVDRVLPTDPLYSLSRD